ncbi:MAG: hypothetical protein WCG03_05605 [Kiritimatiellales bacterium]
MKEKATYRRFDLLAFLAILGCIGMLLFEGFFIFEVYDRAALQPESLIPAQPAVSLSNSTNSPAIEKPIQVQTNSAPVLAEPPAKPVEIEKVPASRGFAEPVVVPAG